MKLVYPFKELDKTKGNEVGGKNAALGEMFKTLKSKGINVPDGFAPSAGAYWKFIRENTIEEPLKGTFSEQRKDDENLKEMGACCRKLVMVGKIPAGVKDQIIERSEELKNHSDSLESVAVRSSETVDDLPEASYPSKTG